MEVRYAIIGTGRIAKEHIKGIKAAKNAKLVGIYSRDFKRAEALAKGHKIKAYKTLDELFNDASVTAVDIVTVNSLHKDLAVQAAKNGKHIILEKPIALTDKDAQEIIRTCKEQSVKLTVISNYRLSKFFLKVKEKIKKNELGDISQVHISIKKRRSADYYNSWQGRKQEVGGGVLIMNVIHMLDLVLDLMGDVEAVSCALNYGQKEVEDACAATLKFKNGALCTINASTTTNINYPESIEIWGSKGAIAGSGPFIRRYTISNSLVKASV